ncbi:MAG TPA: YtxH domain-containing protein [Chitinophagaceae bacterium]|nr:YtxH domain-containing protein [Chitinophagaceae bacterium]
MTSTTKLILGIVGAAAAGVVIGMLLAPDKGSETRRRIGRTAGQWVDNLTHLFHDGKQVTDELVGEAKAGRATTRPKESI